jgi:hypothetical protein
MKGENVQIVKTRGALFFVSVLFFSFFVALIMMSLTGCRSSENMVKRQYIILVSEGRYDQAYQLLSQRIKSKIGDVEKFQKINQTVEKRHEIFGVREELLKRSIKIDGNIVTFRTRTSTDGMSGGREILEGKIYLVVVDGKIDWIHSLGEPVVVEAAEESQA